MDRVRSFDAHDDEVHRSLAGQTHHVSGRATEGDDRFGRPSRLAAGRHRLFKAASASRTRRGVGQEVVALHDVRQDGRGLASSRRSTGTIRRASAACAEESVAHRMVSHRVPAAADAAVGTVSTGHRALPRTPRPPIPQDARA